MTSRAEALKAIPLFAGLSGKDRELLGRYMDELTFAPGATLIKQGQSNHTFFVLVDGKADVEIAGEPRRTLGPADFFGEISMQHRIPATATVVARTEVHAYVMSHEQFGALSAVPAVLPRLMSAIGDRLAEDRLAGSS
jgi:CRP-like cAMP-binding protein